MPADLNRDYYDRNAREFFERTKDLDMEELYRPFLAELRTGARILDAGCGSGRDMKVFGERGYRVLGMDASAEVVRLARENADGEVHHLAFQEVTWQEEFDGIWACASLLHVPVRHLPGVLDRLRRALRTRGVLYLSFKYGQGEREQFGRRFTFLDEPRLRTVFEAVPGLNLREIWRNSSIQRKRHAEVWLNALAEKSR
ncbi:MAG: class I SAM-dependent methyltransferase [Trueperaceae bacterium]